mmetsp:Transcript_17119/g.19474  ORF Transcript_17119/g.19474 Transcript_17119/m.19474 type:complete len:89 (-) Transcript_17119:148-414(-)
MKDNNVSPLRLGFYVLSHWSSPVYDEAFAVMTLRVSIFLCFKASSKLMWITKWVNHGQLWKSGSEVMFLRTKAVNSVSACNKPRVLTT